jgi:hypothetical protein
MKPLTRYTVLFLSACSFLIPKSTADACGFWVSAGEYRFWILQPDLTNEPDLTPFFFASTHIYKGDLSAGKETYPEKNIDEWFAVIKGSAPKTAIDSILNQTDPQDFFDKIQLLSKENAFVGFLSKNNKELFDYLLLSKKTEQIIGMPDPWEENIRPAARFDELVNEFRTLHKNARLQFTKLRTAYQLIRLYRVSGESEKARQLYFNTVDPVQTSSWIKSAALYTVALEMTGAEANYLYSKVFDRGDYNRSYCLEYFQSELYDTSLLLAKNTHEKNLQAAMRLINSPGRSLDEIKKIYRSEPGFKQLPFLILREINKVEDWLVTSKVTDFDPAVREPEEPYDYNNNAKENYASDQLYAGELYKAILAMIAGGKTKQPAVLHLYASHLMLITGNYQAARSHLKQAGAFKGLTQPVRTQLKINRYLLDLENGFTRSVEKQFMDIINTDHKKLAVYDASIMKDQLVLYTAKKMMRQQDRARGLLLLGRTRRAFGDLQVGNYKRPYVEVEEKANESDYDRMISIIEKKNKTAFETFLTKGKFAAPWDYYEDGGYLDRSETVSPEESWSKFKLLDLKCAWYIRNHKIEKAYEAIKQIPDSFYKRSPYVDYIGGNAFYVDVYDPHRVEIEKEKAWHSKKDILKKMIELENLAVKNPGRAAECYYLLANAWYNMSWHGKNWLMVKQWWSMYEMEYQKGSKPGEFERDYYGSEIARKYYNKARVLTKQKDLRALCYYMGERCKNNLKRYEWALWHDDEKMPDKKIDFAKAERTGVDPDYYKQLVQECELYQSFISKWNGDLARK